MAFRGWPVEALEFYEGLEADNSKAYWHRNKEIYERAVRVPMEELLAELEPEFGPVHIFRPYRDVRFSRDKSPYKTAIGGTVGAGYVQLNARGLAAGCGMYDMAPDQLERFRAAIDDGAAGTELEALVGAIREGGITLMTHGALKTAPRGYPKDHPRIELLRLKGLVTWREWEAGAWLGTRRAKDRVVGFLRTSAPVVAWLDANVGASTVADPRR